jgi:hypothetical protein
LIFSRIFVSSSHYCRSEGILFTDSFCIFIQEESFLLVIEYDSYTS